MGLSSNVDLYLFSQVSLLPAITVLHLHVLYPWVHIHLGHAGIKQSHSWRHSTSCVQSGVSSSLWDANFSWNCKTRSYMTFDAHLPENHSSQFHCNKPTSRHATDKQVPLFTGGSVDVHALGPWQTLGLRLQAVGGGAGEGANALAALTAVCHTCQSKNPPIF